MLKLRALGRPELWNGRSSEIWRESTAGRLSATSGDSVHRAACTPSLPPPGAVACGDGGNEQAGYVSYTAVNALLNPPAGYRAQFGEIYVQPVDAIAIAIVDTWETLYFGGLTSSTNDPDADGQNNRAEYWSGTNPTNAASVFQATELDATNGLTIHWPVTPGRVYRVEATENLAGGAWTITAGPWTAAIGESLMRHTVPVLASTSTLDRVIIRSR